MTLLVNFYKELKGNLDLTYVSDVWLPEVGQHSLQFDTCNSCFWNIIIIQTRS